MNWLLDWGTQIESRSGQEDNPVVPSRPSQVASALMAAFTGGASGS
ncbi:MAG: hypothetical protein KGQ51_00065 [Planctomycetes bacterium]|nr:hypothetical protein [Planctomycetota bacterium]